MYRPHSRAHNFDIKIALYVKKIKKIIVKHKGDANICEREESSIHILIVTLWAPTRWQLKWPDSLQGTVVSNPVEHD